MGAQPDHLEGLAMRPFPPHTLHRTMLVAGLLACAPLALAQAPLETPETAADTALDVAAPLPADTTAATPVAEAVPAPAPPAAVTLPDLDPDTYFAGKTGGTFGKNATKVLPGNKRVGVAGFRVVFITDNSIKAQVRASYFGGTDRSGANARMDVALTGVDNATLQAITDQAYASFLAQLALAGRDVVPQSELQAFLSQVEVASGAPYTKEVTLGYGKQTGVAFSPTGMPLWFTHVDPVWGDKGPFKQHNTRSFATASEQLQAILVNPLIVVDFAQMSSSGNRSGFLAREAEVGATLAMSVGAFSSNITRAEKAHSGIVTKGDDATVSLQQPIVSEIGFATLEQLKEEDNSGAKGIFDAIGKGMGLANAGGPARRKSANAANTNNQAYSEAATDALARATGTFAGWFRKYPAN
jgi:hypothetical protein